MEGTELCGVARILQTRVQYTGTEAQCTTNDVM